MPSEFTREDYEHAARAAGLEINEFMMEQRREIGRASCRERVS
jgi:hypothetical protein